MDVLTIFLTQFTLSIVVFTLLGRWIVAPWLALKPVGFALTILVIPHAFRHVGLAFLVPGMNFGELPYSFAIAAAYGDFVSGMLAIIAVCALRGEWRIALPAVWLFNVVGLADLLNALRHTEAVLSFGATWLIPTFVVPLLLVSHVMIFARLVHPAEASATIYSR